jgi:hypothetical protein
MTTYQGELHIVRSDNVHFGGFPDHLRIGNCFTRRFQRSCRERRSSNSNSNSSLGTVLFGLSPGSSAATVYNSCSETYQLPNALSLSLSLFYIVCLSVFLLPFPSLASLPFLWHTCLRCGAAAVQFSY